MCRAEMSKNQFVPVGRPRCSASSPRCSFCSITSVSASKSLADLAHYTTLAVCYPSIMLSEAWCAINLRPVFTCLTLATAPLLDTAFSLNPLRISRNRTMTEVSFLHFLTFIDRPARLTLCLPSSPHLIPLETAANLSPRVNGSHVCRQLPSCLIWFHAYSSGT